MKPDRHVVAAAVSVLALAVVSCSSSSEQSSTTSAPTTEAAVVTPVIGVVLAAPIPVPATDSRVHLATLEHTIGVSLKQPMPPLVPATMTETIAPTEVQTRKPVEIAPPLDGPNWLDANGCCAMTAHRMAVSPLNGEFAIDFVQLTGGRLFAGDQKKVESYPYFGADVHAGADGPVVAVRDGLPEQTPGVSPTGLPLDRYGGNHVVEDIGDGNYAFYAHLQTGSVKVKPGDQLTSGQTIGLLGNSGNTDAPHLHFHVMSTADPLLSNGLPFIIRSFRLESRLASENDIDGLVNGGPAKLQPGFAAREVSGVSPLFLDVMSYAVG